MRFELMTSSLPRRRSTPELRGPLTEDSGAGDEIRTRDPQLGRLMLYQLSYTRSKISKFPSGAGGRIRTCVGREPAGFTARCH
jgi:hypothetical protein